jgi:hypothetical protein
LKISIKIICAAIANTFIAAPVFAEAFVGAVVNTSTAPGPPTQPLTIRVVPGNTQTSLGFVVDGGNLSLGGKCRRYNAAWSSYISFNLKNLTQAQGQAKIHQSRTWCQLQFEPTPNVFKVGWANANYVDLQ